MKEKNADTTLHDQICTIEINDMAKTWVNCTLLDIHAKGWRAETISGNEENNPATWCVMHLPVNKR